MVPKLCCALESTRGLVKTQIAVSQLHSSWFSKSGMESENLHFKQVPRKYWSCSFWIYTLGITNIKSVLTTTAITNFLKLRWLKTVSTYSLTQFLWAQETGSSLAKCFCLKVSRGAAVKIQVRAAVIWRLQWAWGFCFLGGSCARPLAGGLNPSLATGRRIQCLVIWISSQGGLSVLTSWWQASPTAGDLR